MKASTTRVLASTATGFIVALALQHGLSFAQQGRGPELPLERALAGWQVLPVDQLQDSSIP